MILKDKIFDVYEVDVPLERDAIIFYGPNGSYKTKTLELIYKHYLDEKENVLFFETDRCFYLTQEEVEALIVTNKLTGDEIFEQFDLNLSLKIDHYGGFISSGLLQILNIFGQVQMLKEPAVIIIDTPEKNLHIANQRIFMDSLLKTGNVKKLIVATHSPSIFAEHSLGDVGVDITKCVHS